MHADRRDVARVGAAEDANRAVAVVGDGDLVAVRGRHRSPSASSVRSSVPGSCGSARRRPLASAAIDRDRRLVEAAADDRLRCRCTRVAALPRGRDRRARVWRPFWLPWLATTISLFLPSKKTPCGSPSPVFGPRIIAQRRVVVPGVAPVDRRSGAALRPTPRSRSRTGLIDRPHAWCGTLSTRFGLTFPFGVVREDHHPVADVVVDGVDLLRLARRRSRRR